MIFQEKQTEDEYTYTVEDVFGKMEIRSPNRLVADDGDAEFLDEVFDTIYNHHLKDRTSKPIEGSVQDTDITYTYQKEDTGFSEVLDIEATTFIEETFGRPLQLMSSNKKHLFALWYADNGYKLTDDFKEKVLELKK